MTPKEKAKELIMRFVPFVEVNKIPLFKAKKCALIAVEEIIKSRPLDPILRENPYFETVSDRVDETIEYWEEVKEELEKL